ncbi:MAG: hypothetical protein QF371_00570 [Flavobacteriales bacterium]|nr:hypothetical protein [Flavobacteriales bacterium]
MSELEPQVSQERTSTGETDESLDFDKIFDTPSDPFTSEDQTVKSEEEAGSQETVTAENQPDSDSYQYWQSQADKKARELDDVMKAFGVQDTEQLTKEVENLKTVAPISRYIQSNPDILDVVENSLSNGNPRGQTPQQGNPEHSLKKPERPTKPANYDPDEALADPSSDSFKFREAMDNYRDDMLSFQDSRYDSMMMAQQQQAEAYVQAQQVEGIRGELESKYEFSRDEAEKFITNMSDPSSITMDNLVALFRMQNSQQDPQQTPQQEQNPVSQPESDMKMDEMKRERDRLSAPSPVGVSKGGSAESNVREEDQIMDAMVRNYEKTNPW